jgi:hypothetical protein
MHRVTQLLHRGLAVSGAHTPTGYFATFSTTNQSVPSVYYQDYDTNVYEKRGTGERSKASPGTELHVCSAFLGTPLAGVSWTNIEGNQVCQCFYLEDTWIQDFYEARIYTIDPQGRLQECYYSHTGNSWLMSDLNMLKLQLNVGSSITAVQWSAHAHVQLRVYYQSK